MATYQPVVLRGDYTDTGQPHAYERQQQAADSGCLIVVEFHFNSAGDSGARGGEVHFQHDRQESRELADRLWSQISSSTGLPPHGEPLRSTNDATRSRFITHYLMPCALLEPLFISNPEQATWLHQPANLQALAQGVAQAITIALPRGGVVGLSAGHAYKNSSPSDPGSGCAQLDWEVDHTVACMEAVANLL
jgi:N-acetylmuramoyl-L-alanine amidase